MARHWQDLGISPRIYSFVGLEFPRSTTDPAYKTPRIITRYGSLMSATSCLRCLHPPSFPSLSEMIWNCFFTRHWFDWPRKALGNSLETVNRCGSSAFHSNTDPWLPVRIVKILWEHVGREKLSLATVDDWSRDESFLRWIKLISIRNIMLVAGMCRLFPGEWRIS